MELIELEDHRYNAASRAEPVTEAKVDECDAELAELPAILRLCTLDDAELAGLILAFESGRIDDDDLAALELTVEPGARGDAELVGFVIAVLTTVTDVAKVVLSV